MHSTTAELPLRPLGKDTFLTLPSMDDTKEHASNRSRRFRPPGKCSLKCIKEVGAQFEKYIPKKWHNSTSAKVFVEVIQVGTVLSERTSLSFAKSLVPCDAPEQPFHPIIESLVSAISNELSGKTNRKIVGVKWRAFVKESATRIGYINSYNVDHNKQMYSKVTKVPVKGLATALCALITPLTLEDHVSNWGKEDWKFVGKQG